MIQARIPKRGLIVIACLLAILGMAGLAYRRLDQTLLPRGAAGGPGSISSKEPNSEIPATGAKVEQLRPGLPALKQDVQQPLLGATRLSGEPLVLADLEEFKEEGGRINYASQTYGASFTEGKVTVTPRPSRQHGPASFSYEFQEARCGEALLASRGGPVLPRSRGKGQVVFTHEKTFEERYTTRKDGVEQDFLIHELPAERGDLRIVGNVTTDTVPPPIGTKGPKLSFTRAGKEAFVVSEALVFDAKGSKLSLDLEFRDGQIAMLVPAEWMKGAELPITVDPLIGGPLIVSDPFGGAHDYDIDYNPSTNQYLAAYKAPSGLVYAQRISNVGALVGSAVLLDASGGTNLAVSYAPDTNRFIVAWVRASWPDYTVKASIFNADGTLHTSQITIFGPSSEGAQYVTAAYTGANTWFVGWMAFNSGGIYWVGSIVPTSGTPVSSAGSWGYGNWIDIGMVPSIAYSNRRGLVTYQTGTTGSTGGLYIESRNSAGSQVGSAVAIDDPSGFWSTVAGGINDNFLTMWTDGGGVKARVATGYASSNPTFDTPQIYMGGYYADAAYSSSLNQWCVISNSQFHLVGTNGLPSNSGSFLTAAHSSAQSGRIAWNSVNNEAMGLYFGTATPSGASQLVAQRMSLPAPLPAPSGLSATSVDNVVYLSWGGISGATSYNIFRSTTANEYGSPIAANVTSTTFIDTGMQFGQSHHYVVRATAYSSSLGTTAESPYSNAANITLGQSPPSAPTNLSGAPMNSSVSLSWNSVPGVTDYEVRRSTTTGVGHVAIGTTTNTAYNDSYDVQNGLTYYYVVCARDSNGTGAKSNQVMVTPLSASIPALLVVGNLTLNGGDSAIRLQLEALGYSVALKVSNASLSASDANGKAVVAISSTVNHNNVTTKFRDIAIPVVIWEHQLYDDMKMTASGAANLGAQSGQNAVSMVSANASHPMAAGLTSSVTVLNSNHALAWGVPSADAISIATVVGNSTRRTIFGYEAGSMMVGQNAPARRVGIFLNDSSASALSSNGKALFDAAVRWAVNAPSAPISVSAVPGNGAIELSWSGNLTDLSYTIERSTNGGSYATLVSGLTRPGFTDTAVALGTNYQYRVSATGVSGTSLYSPAVSISIQQGGNLVAFVTGRACLKALDNGQTAPDGDWNNGDYTAKVFIRNGQALVPLTAADLDSGSGFTFPDNTNSGNIQIVTQSTKTTVSIAPTVQEVRRFVKVLYTAKKAGFNDLEIPFTVWMDQRPVVRVVFRFPEDVALRTGRHADAFAGNLQQPNATRDAARGFIATSLLVPTDPYAKNFPMRIYGTPDYTTGLQIGGVNTTHNAFITSASPTPKWQDSVATAAFKNCQSALLTDGPGPNQKVVVVFLVKKAGILVNNPINPFFEIGGQVSTISPKLFMVIADNTDPWVLLHELGHIFLLPDIFNNSEITNTLNNLTPVYGSALPDPDQNNPMNWNIMRHNTWRVAGSDGKWITTLQAGRVRTGAQGHPAVPGWE